MTARSSLKEGSSPGAAEEVMNRTFTATNAYDTPEQVRESGWERATPATPNLRPASVDGEDAVWAHVFMDPESHEPTLLPDDMLAEARAALDDITSGQFIDKAWIRPGPLLEPAPPSKKAPS